MGGSPPDVGDLQVRGRFGGVAIAVSALALGLASAAGAGTIQVTSADAEYAAFHPRARAAAAPVSGEDFQATMDRVFGPGRWRKTSGYRTQAQEDALRRQGAGTVAPGHISRHSIGGADSPSAYDAVVDHMPLASAAAKLRQAGGGFSRVLAEGAHGPQGAHLHIELDRSAARPAEAVAEAAVYRRGLRGRKSPELARASAAGAGEN